MLSQRPAKNVVSKTYLKLDSSLKNMRKSNWIISPAMGEKIKKCLKPPHSHCLGTFLWLVVQVLLVCLNLITLEFLNRWRSTPQKMNECRHLKRDQVTWSFFSESMNIKSYPTKKPSWQTVNMQDFCSSYSIQCPTWIVPIATAPNTFSGGIWTQKKLPKIRSHKGLGALVNNPFTIYPAGFSLR